MWPFDIRQRFTGRKCLEPTGHLNAANLRQQHLV
jgi:hypothetical protein